jgi:hypothetical protein
MYGRVNDPHRKQAEDAAVKEGGTRCAGPWGLCRTVERQSHTIAGTSELVAALVAGIAA